MLKAFQTKGKESRKAQRSQSVEWSRVAGNAGMGSDERYPHTSFKLYCMPTMCYVGC